MKTCPICKELCQDDWNCCPICGSDLSDPDNRPTVHQGDDNTFIGNTFIDGVQSDNVSIVNTPTNSDHSNSAKHPTVEMGNDNTAIINTNDNSTTENSNNTTQINSNNTTNNTTIYEAQKSKSELQERDLEAFRQECKKQYKNGLITKEGEDILNELQRRYALSDELVLPIKEDVKKKSRKPITQLPLAVLSGIQQTKSLIEQNSPTALNRKLKELDSWMKEYEDDALKAYYFQLSSMLEPTRYTERYEESAKNEYWEVFWAYIAYLLQNKEKQAFDAQASLGRLQSAYPEQNEVLLRLAGLLMQNDPIEDIKQGYNVRALNCSQELKLLLDTVDELLQKDWSAEPPIKIREVHSFYVDTLFKSFIDTQKADGEKKRKALEYTSRIDREKQIELQRKKGFLLQKFGEVENIEKACQVLGISELTLQDWLKDDPSFNSSYNDIVRRIEDKKDEEDKKARIAKELEERIKQQKSEFKSKYEQNGCDFSKTCSDLNIDRDNVRIWRGTDKAFDDGLSFIEREHEKKLQELFVQFYDSNGCDLQKACAEAGISLEKLNGWRKSDKEFDGVLTAIENEHIQVIKDLFIECYKNNDCDLEKTCIESGVDSVTLCNWKSADLSFAENIQFIEQEYHRRQHVLLRNRRNAKIKKAMPYILMVILLGLAVFGVKTVIENKREAKEVAAKIAADEAQRETMESAKKEAEKKKDQDQYAALCKEFDEIFTTININDNADVFKNVLDAIVTKYSQIKEFESTHDTTISDIKSPALRQKILDSLKAMKSDFNNRATTTPNVNESKDWAKKIDYINSLINTIL